MTNIFLKRLSINSQSIYHAILASFFGALLVVLVRYLSSDFHIFFIVMVRNFLALLLLLPQILNERKTIFKTDKIGLHFFRSFNGLISMFIWFYIVTIMPLSEAVSISFLVPILTTIVAIYFLKEKPNKNIILSVFLGIIGVLLILRPGFREFNSYYILSFVSLFLWTISQTLVKVMTRTESSQTIVVYMTLIMFLASIPFGLFYLQEITIIDFSLLLALGLVSNLLHFSISNAYKNSDLSFVQPFDFMRLVFTAVIAYFVFDELIDFWVVIGSIVILIGVIIVLPKRKSKLLKLESKESL